MGHEQSLVQDAPERRDGLAVRDVAAAVSWGSVAREFRKNIAVLIGIDDYQHGIPRLTTAVRDAQALQDCLTDDHGYEVVSLLDGQASLAGLRTLLQETLPDTLDAEDRLVFYFAGHGIAQDGDDGPEGFLVPQDARPEDRASLLPMVEVAAAIDGLPFHHMLLVFDCCFAGSFRWSSTRSFLPANQTLYRKRYERFLDFPAAQVLTSAAQDEKALDVIDGLTIGERDTPEGHSPFATALLQGLRGDADLPGPDGTADGVITATELYLYVRDVVELAAEDRGTQQTPGLWPMPRHDRGEFLFHTPGVDAVIKEDPPLDYASNPWRGLQAYTREQTHLFFGRTRVVDELAALVAADGHPLIAVVGASGSGKSSVVNAGLLPQLRDTRAVVGPLRPGSDPAGMLDDARGALAAATGPQLLVIDQFEEILTMVPSPEVTADFLAGLAALRRESPDLTVILTLRADFEPPLRDSPIGDDLARGRYPIPPMTRDEMREVIDGPAADRVLYFEPPSLPDQILDDLAAMPGALPLLSFTLSELYRRTIEEEERTDRALHERHYRAVGGVVGSLQTRASELFSASSPDEQRTMRNLMLRMVSDAGGDVAKRRLAAPEQRWSDDAESERVQTVLARLVDARLLVTGVAEDPDGGEEPYVEPAHDMLVMTWDRLRQWQRALEVPLKLRRAVWQAAVDWDRDGRRRPRLWHDDVRLPQIAGGRRGEDAWVNGLEAAFVDASLRHREFRRKRFNIVAMLIAGVLLGVTIYALGKQVEAVAAAEVAASERDRAKEAGDRAEKAAAAALASSITADEKRKEADRQAGIARDKTLEAEQSAIEAADAADEARRQTGIALDAKEQALADRDRAARALARTSASQARALTRLHGVGNEALTMAVRAADKDALLRPEDTATAVLSEVLDAIRGPTLGNGQVALGALMGDTVVTGGNDGQVMAWSPGGWDRAWPATPPHKAPVTALEPGPDGALASGDARGEVLLWERDEGPTGLRLARRSSVGAPIRQLRWGPQGLIVGADDGGVSVIDAGVVHSTAQMLAGPLRSLAVSRDGRIAVGGEDGLVVVLESDGTRRELRGHLGWSTRWTSPPRLGAAPTLRTSSRRARTARSGCGPARVRRCCRSTRVRSRPFASIPGGCTSPPRAGTARSASGRRGAPSSCRWSGMGAGCGASTGPRPAGRCSAPGRTARSGSGRGRRPRRPSPRACSAVTTAGCASLGSRRTRCRPSASAETAPRACGPSGVVRR